MRAKQQNLHCSYCKELNQYMLITDNVETTIPEDTDSLLEYKEGAIYFTNIIMRKKFQDAISCTCPFTGEKFDDAALY